MSKIKILDKEEVVTDLKLQRKPTPKIPEGKRPGKKRMRSLWVVLLTAFTTATLAGGGTVGYFYWKENFSKPKEESAPQKDTKAVSEKIKGKNLVVVTSDEEKLFLNFINLEDSKVITKEIKLGTTIRGGKWAEDNKNALVQTTDDGKSLVFAEKKEKNFSDNEAYFKFIKTDIEGKNQETLIDSPDYANFGNFVFTGDKIFFLKGALKETSSKSKGSKDNKDNEETKIWNLESFDLETKKEETLSTDIGNFFQGTLEYKDGKVFSLYKDGSKFFEASFDTATGKLDKNFLFSYKKTKDFDLAVENIFPGPSRQTFIYKDYTAKDGYSLKSFNLITKKIDTLVKDKNFSPDKVSWLSSGEIIFLKTPAFSNLPGADTSNEIVKLNLSIANTQESLAASSKILTPLFFNTDSGANSFFFLDDAKLIYEKDKDKKEFQIKGLSQPSDALFAGVFDY